MAAGGEFTDEGSYATPVQLGYLMKKGEYVGRLPQVTLKSTLQKMLGQDLMDVSKGSFSGLDSNPSLLMNMELINN
jgi:PmbA protein